MRKKRNTRNIAQKITSSILTIAISCSLLIGLVGVISISVINAQSQRVYKENLVPLKPLYQAQADFQSMRSNLRSMALEASLNYNSGTNYVNTINSYQEDMIKQLAAYKKNISSDAEKTNFNIIELDTGKYKDVVSSMIASIQAGQIKQAVDILNSSDQLAKEIKGNISNAFNLNTNQARQRDQTASIIFYVATAVVLAFSLAFIFISMKISKRVADGISLPIHKMVAAAESIADGKLDVDLAISSGDETGILAEAFRKIVSSLTLLKEDVNTLIQEALEGRLDTRADTSRHSGDYKDIIGGVNKMFDTIKEPLDVASAFINRLADGEHQEDIENTYKGYYATLIDNLNKVRTSINILEDEAQKLAKAGVDGDLEVRGDENKLKGIYAQIIHGVNQTFDAIKSPLDVASVFIDSLAEGTTKNPIENTYKGYYATLIENLNRVLGSLHILLVESTRLAEAGTRGDLTVRSDVSKVPGQYADIVGGMNGILDAIAIPLDESARVISKISYNDFTDRMTGEYNGAFKEFSNSINLVRDRLLSIQDALVKLSNGDLSRLEEFKRIGRRSENDQIMPAVTAAYQVVQDLINESNNLSKATYEGKLDVRGDADHFRGDYRQIIDGMNRTMEAISDPISEISHMLQELASGNLTMKVTKEYLGEYNRIKEAFNYTTDSFNDLLGQINMAASQVSVGSKQVSDASQSLSRGATEQASSIEELTSSMAEVAAQTKQNAGDATQASLLSSTAQEEAAQGKQKMGQMLDSMREINESSTSISKIIKVIDDIAFQTNILALNAAVEAARAGQYGKGFAVVAEEVRNLAGKSAEAAKETTGLIEGSIAKVESGTKIANETADMLNKISESVKKATNLIKNIAVASNEQATAISQIDQGVGQVSTVVQTNSATAEESAASSEELSGQAETLMQMVDKFKLRNTDIGNSTAKNL